MESENVDLEIWIDVSSVDLFLFERILEVKKFAGRRTFKVQALLFELRYILIGQFLNLQDSLPYFMYKKTHVVFFVFHLVQLYIFT